MVAIGEVSRVVSGATPRTGEKRFWDGEVLWTTPKDISELNSPYLDRPPRSITEEGLRSCAASVLPTNSVLLSSRAPIGLVAINRLPVATNQGFKSLVPDHKKIDSKFLYHWLKSKKDHLQNLGNGATFKEISKAAVERIEIPLPPLAEQRRIAAILDKADALRRKRRQALDLLDSLTQSIFLEMFGARQNSDWPTCTIGEVASDIRTGPFGSQLLHSEFVNEGISVLGIDNAVANEFRWVERRFITSEKYRKLARYTVRPGDVLITIMGTCGRCAVVPEDIPTSINTKHLCCITLDREKCLPEFLHATFLQDPAVLRQLGVQSKGAVMPGLNMGVIKDLRISLPPIDQQQAYASLVRNLQVQKQSRLRAASNYDVLFASLQSRAFSGQL